MDNKCNHKIQSDKSTLIILDDFMCMTNPTKLYCVCRICQNSFTFIKDKKGKFKKSKENETC